MSGHILFCGVTFDARPQGINAGRLVRALLDLGLEITVLCGREKSASTPFTHPRLHLESFSVEPRNPKLPFQWLARAQGQLPCSHYLWSQRVARYRPARRPDVVYGRAWPYGSFVGAYNVSRALELPMWMHFSDPIPAPPKLRDHEYVMQGLRRIADHAQGASFVTEQALRYELQFLPPKPAGWAQTLNHIAPEPAEFGAPDGDTRFVYIGSFSDSRPPDALLAGFARYAQAVPDARIHCVGTRADSVRPAAQRAGVAERVLLEPYTRDIQAWQARASVLLAVDWLAGEPVYMLTKTIESMVVDRPLLLLTQAGSPGAALAAQCPDTVVCVTSTAADAVADGFARAAQMARRPGDYAARRALLAPYAADQVARRCASLLLGPSWS